MVRPIANSTEKRKINSILYSEPQQQQNKIVWNKENNEKIIQNGNIDKFPARKYNIFNTNLSNI